MIEYTYINDAEEIKDNISDNKCKIVHMKRKSNGYFINVICCQFSDEEQLKNNWEELVTNVADVVQKNLVKRIEIFNVYIIFFQSEINGVIEDSIEQNKYSSRKLVINKRMPESNEELKGIINQKLFELNIENINTGRHQIKKRAIGIKNLKKYYLPNPLPLFDWNIEHYSSSIKISIEEKDNEVTEQKLIETTSNFASNFEFNIGLGETIKKGAKFGASASTTQKVSTTITTHLDSEQLGDVIINFGDDIVIKNEMDAVVSGVPGRASYKTTYRPVLNPKYTSGYYKIEVLPLALY